jgi:membrane-associated phospholipid phosphatase
MVFITYIRAGNVTRDERLVLACGTVLISRKMIDARGVVVPVKKEGKRHGGKRVLLATRGLLIGMALLAGVPREGYGHPEAPRDSTIAGDRGGYTPGYKKLVVPAILIGYGVASLNVKALKRLNYTIREKIIAADPVHIKLDNYTQYAPAVLVHGLTLAGVRGRHGLKGQAIIYLSSQCISTLLVVPLKHATRERRPDARNSLSFPSGHTATAFSSAHFMFREYRDNRFWLSLSGYPFAIFTGVYRMLNDRHWAGDVVAGAGIGVLSTEIAYWIYPAIRSLTSGKRGRSPLVILPCYRQEGFGVGLVKHF